MQKYNFRNDYSEGAHPRILEALARASGEQNEGYGLDRHSLRAAEFIRAACAAPQAAVSFVEGGTQANLLAAAALLRPWESVVAAETGHIHGHESGSIESAGHKIIAVPGTEGKLTAAAARRALEQNREEYCPRPGMLYLSDSSETGTVYTREELQELRELCREEGLRLFVDGARLGSALCVEGGGVTLETVAACADMFTIGGTKNGALLGEALVTPDPALAAGFRRLMKQRGAMLAKGMVLGVQFEELFSDGLFFQLARHANAQAERLRQGLAGLGFRFFASSPTNQLFPLLPARVEEPFRRLCACEIWGRQEGETAVRLVTSWATRPETVEAFLRDCAALL